jgi:hypothetical protein
MGWTRLEALQAGEEIGAAREANELVVGKLRRVPVDPELQIVIAEEVVEAVDELVADVGRIDGKEEPGRSSLKRRCRRSGSRDRRSSPPETGFVHVLVLELVERSRPDDAAGLITMDSASLVKSSKLFSAAATMPDRGLR